jgi:GNAT superfamily N-acetyltransferase
MPPLTPWMGMLLEYPPSQSKTHSRYSFERNTVQELLSQLPGHSYFNVCFHPKFRNWLPLKWKGYKQTVQVTYVLEDISDHKIVQGNYKGSVRTDIKKARATVRVEESDDINMFYDLNKKTFERQGMEIPYSRELMQNIDEALSKRKWRHIWMAKDLDGNYHAGVYIAYDNETAYCLAIASDPEYRGNGAISLLLDHAIEEAAFKVKRFDFEGGNIEQIESLFRAYGAEQDLYSRIYRSKNKFTDALMTLIGKF